MPDAPCSALILAAGRSDRMHSARPQPVHLLCGRPMVQYVVDALPQTLVDRIVMVVGDGAEVVTKKLNETAADPRLSFVEAPTGRGSADDALNGVDGLGDDWGDEDLIVVPGNAPLLRRDTVEELVAAHRATGAAATLLSVPPGNPRFGRIIVGKDPGTVARVTHDDDFPEDSLAASGVFVVRRSLLAPAIRRIRPLSLGEIDLAGLAEVLSSAGHLVSHHLNEVGAEVAPVEDRVDLATAEAAIRERTNRAWMRRGVTMVDPHQTYVDTTVRLAPDVTLFPGTMLQGATVVGAGAEIGPDTRLADCAIGAGCRVEKTMARDAEVGEGAHVGPFAVLEPGSQVASATTTGPFYHAPAPD